MGTCTLEVTEITSTYDSLLQDILGFRSGGVKEGIDGEGGGNSIITIAWQANYTASFHQIVELFQPPLMALAISGTLVSAQ
ncbi:hypothetical protein [Microbulbifer sp. GL-2]|uniref:hypothetical protein n=1 Tax=Microbulbifer sp. GL-2 TaxID=2591606 RepID=UPI00117F44D0|nr:hypothetical protein [Microbulbifer sp. GL-2]